MNNSRSTDRISESEQAQWWEIRQAYASTGGPNIDPREETYQLVQDEFDFITFRDTEEMYVYDRSTGIYEPGGESALREWLVSPQRLGNQFERSKINDLLYRIESATYVNRETLGPDEQNPKVCVGNGVLDLSEINDPQVDEPEIELLDHSPAHQMITRIPVEYNPDADCPAFNAFLDNVVAKPEDKQLIYEFIGYCLWPGYPFAKALFLYGDGRNGKSTLLDVIRQLFGGEENVSSRSLQDLEKQRFAAADLYGRLANIAADLPDETLSQTGMIKTLAGGDLVTGEQKFQAAFSFENRAKLLFAANNPPIIEDDTTAIYRRLLLIHFPNEFTPPGEPGPDARPKDDLMAEISNPDELSGILNRAITVISGVFERGEFSQSDSADEVREHYQRISEPISAFAEECVVENSSYHVAKDRLYTVYKAWARANETPIKTKSVLSRKLAKFVDFETARPGQRGNRQYAYDGIGITNEGWSYRDDDSDDDDDDGGEAASDSSEFSFGIMHSTADD